LTNTPGDGLCQQEDCTMDIHTLTPQDGARLYAVWLRGVAEHPSAFGSTVDEFQRTVPTAFTEQHLTKPDRFLVLGALRRQELVGFVALARDTRTKLCHTATLGPLYVIPEARQQGVGAALMAAALHERYHFSGI